MPGFRARMPEGKRKKFGNGCWSSMDIFISPFVNRNYSVQQKSTEKATNIPMNRSALTWDWMDRGVISADVLRGNTRIGPARPAYIKS